MEKYWTKNVKMLSEHTICKLEFHTNFEIHGRIKTCYNNRLPIYRTFSPGWRNFQLFKCNLTLIWQRKFIFHCCIERAWLLHLITFINTFHVLVSIFLLLCVFFRWYTIYLCEKHKKTMDGVVNHVFSFVQWDWL